MPFHLPVLPDNLSVEFTDGEGVRWRRDGLCNRCGECCTGNPFTGNSEASCPVMVRDAEGLAICTDRSEVNTYYHNACVHWPSHPAQTADKPGCSYTFTRVE